MDRIWKLSLMIVGLILADQFSKGVIQSSFTVGESVPVLDGFFSITYVRNPGAAFGFLGTAHESIRRPILIGLPIVAGIWLMALIWKGRKGHILPVLAYSLIFAGAIGNLIDRIALNYVVDFLDFYLGDNHFPAFNIADSAISVGGALVGVDAIREWRESKAQENEGDAQADAPPSEPS